MKAKGEGSAKEKIVNIKDSMEVNLSKLWERVKDGEAWCAEIHRVTRDGHN